MIRGGGPPVFRRAGGSHHTHSKSLTQVHWLLSQWLFFGPNSWAPRRSGSGERQRAEARPGLLALAATRRRSTRQSVRMVARLPMPRPPGGGDGWVWSKALVRRRAFDQPAVHSAHRYKLIDHEACGHGNPRLDTLAARVASALEAPAWPPTRRPLPHARPNSLSLFRPSARRTTV